jgi:hypothetical protein
MGCNSFRGDELVGTVSQGSPESIWGNLGLKNGIPMEGVTKCGIIN